jgi:2-polyprenyl-3-methyl-5-hydroxy-6-metoxy-1,4-benzoquinol methylase
VADAIEFHSKRVQSLAKKYVDSREFRARVQVWSRLIAMCGDPSADVIDVGCGVGTFSFIAAPAFRSVVGVDGSEQMIVEAQRRAVAYPNVTFRVGRLETLAHDAGAVGLVLCSSVIEYVDDFDRGMDVLAALTAPGGHMIVSIANASSVYRKLEAISYRLFRWPAYFGLVRNLRTAGEMRSAGGARGLSLVQVAYYGRLGRSLIACLFAREASEADGP